MAVVLVVAPHPDDETLGCGGALLRHADAGDAVHWLIATAMTEAGGFGAGRIRERAAEIEAVAHAYRMTGVHPLGFPTARLDAHPLHELVTAASAVVEKIAPEVVYLPHPGDAHSDHRRAFEMCASALKWFRQPSVREVLGYETLSETGFLPGEGTPPFRPAVYVDVTPWIERKLEILAVYRGETAPFPFPRSAEAVRALAALRGAEAGFRAAEAFSALRMRR